MRAGLNFVSINRHLSPPSPGHASLENAINNNNRERSISFNQIDRSKLTIYRIFFRRTGIHFFEKML